MQTQLAPFRRPGQAKREPGSQKIKRFDLLRSRIRLRLSGMTATAIRWRARKTLLSQTAALFTAVLASFGRDAGLSSLAAPCLSRMSRAPITLSLAHSSRHLNPSAANSRSTVASRLIDRLRQEAILARAPMQCEAAATSARSHRRCSLQVFISNIQAPPIGIPQSSYVQPHFSRRLRDPIRKTEYFAQVHDGLPCDLRRAGTLPPKPRSRLDDRLF